VMMPVGVLTPVGGRENPKQLICEGRVPGVPPGRWTSKAGSLVGQLRGCSRGDYKKIIHGGVPG
jgi:hypothetical protein